MTLRRNGPAAAAVAVAFAMPLPALGTTSLTYYWSNIQCGVSAIGGPVYSSCDVPSFTALAQPGQSVFVEATLNWSYSDDGLPLQSPGLFQLDTTGRRNLFASYEAAGLYLTSNQCRDERGNCPIRTEFVDAFDGPNYLIFGNDAHPDSFTGQATYRASRTVVGNWPSPALATAGMGVYHNVAYSGVLPAIPEPSSYALLVAGLMTLAVKMRRRAAFAS
jgi:hypothetical protein